MAKGRGGRRAFRQRRAGVTPRRGCGAWPQGCPELEPRGLVGLAGSQAWGSLGSVLRTVARLCAAPLGACRKAWDGEGKAGRWAVWPLDDWGQNSVLSALFPPVSVLVSGLGYKG